MALESLKLCGVVVIGFAIGLSGLAFLQHATEASEYTLILLLFLVGIQLRNNGMTLKQIVLNRRGMIVAVVVVVSSLIGGLINAFILDLPINTALAMASGFGWYSLSGIFIDRIFWSGNRERGVFNDLARELIAIMLIRADSPQPLYCTGLMRCHINGFHPARSSTYWRAGYGPGGNCSRFYS